MSLGLRLRDWSLVTWSALGGVAALVSPASAHVSVSSPGFANQTQVLTFGVGHGCEGADTTRIEVRIPSDVTSVSALPSFWGEAELVTNDAGLVTSVVWKKDKARANADHYYQFAIRVKLPDAPFTTLYFPTKQSCKLSNGEEKVTDWAALPGESKQDSSGEEDSPAPAVQILPVRTPGWNKFKVAKDVTDLKIFNDAEIVWSGDAAYSGNPATAELIKAESGVTELKEIKAGAEIWVKY